jgi:hypothetical protein
MQEYLGGKKPGSHLILSIKVHSYTIFYHEVGAKNKIVLSVFFHIVTQIFRIAK